MTVDVDLPIGIPSSSGFVVGEDSFAITSINAFEFGVVEDGFDFS